MSDLFPVTAVVAGVLGLAAGGLVPRMIAAVPEPDPEPEPDHPEGEELDEGIHAADPDPEPEEPKEPYADIAARPGLLWKAVLASGACAAAVGLVLGWSYGLLVVLPLVPVSVALSVIDWRTRLLPTRLIAPAYAVTLALVLLSWLVGAPDRHDLVRVAVGWVFYGGIFFALWFIYPRGLGYGDVRLSGLLGIALAWLGFPQLLTGMWAGILFGGVLGGLLSLATRRRDYPFGPFMLLGALTGVVLGQPVMSSLYG